MFRLFRTCLLVLFLISTTTVVNSETSWITKKKHKTKKVEKVEKVEKKVEKSDWIKKKEVNENKKKLKEKIKESKSWITKKSKEKLKEIKKNLKKHRNIDNLPKAELYFAAMIEPSENQETLYLYGYINSNKKSDESKKFKFNNTSYYSLNDGIVYFDDGKTSCQADAKKGVLFDNLKGEIIITCNKKKVIGASIDFVKNGKYGNGNGEYTNGSKVEFEFYTSKNEAIAKLDLYKTSIYTRTPTPPPNKEKIILEPNGKYYALLIGNSKYDNGWQDLTSPVSDINAIKSVLDKSYKFEKILTVKNGSKKQIYDAFKELSKLSTTNDYVLVYYSGHGKIKAEQAYWIPADGSKEWGNGDWINISELDIFLTEIKAHHLAVLVDSCFVGTKFKGINIIDDISISNEKLFGESLISALNLRTRSVLSSGTSGEVSDTVAGTNHSRFALAILNMLNQFNEESYPLNLELLASLMKNYSYSGTFQKPLMYHPDTWQHGGGDFIFIPKKNLK